MHKLSLFKGELEDILIINGRFKEKSKRSILHLSKKQQIQTDVSQFLHNSLNNSNEEGNTDSDQEEDLFDYIKASSHSTEEEDPLFKKLEGNVLDVASKAAKACQKVMNIYTPKDKETKVHNKLPKIMSNYRKRFENVLRSPNPISEDSNLYLVRSQV